MKNHTKRWLHGLVAAAIAGAASSATLLIADPHTFNLAEWRKVVSVACVAAVVGVLLYLKQFPPPIAGPERKAARKRGGAIVGVLLIVSMSAASCAGAIKANQQATRAAITAESATHAALVSANARINELCDPGGLAETCRMVRLASARVYDSAAAYARALLAGRWDAFVAVVNDISAAVREVSALPPGKMRDAIVADLQRAVPVFRMEGGR